MSVFQLCIACGQEPDRTGSKMHFLQLLTQYGFREIIYNADREIKCV